MNDPKSQNGWNEWSRHVLAELKRLTMEVGKLDKSMQSDKIELLKNIERIRSDIQLLKFQASMWGMIAGFIVSGIIAFINKG